MTGLFGTLINTFLYINKQERSLVQRTQSSERWNWLPGLHVGCVTLGELPQPQEVDAISPIGSFSGLDKMS